MKFTTSILAVASAFALVAAQNTTDYTCLTTTELRMLIPTCALVCQAEALAATTCEYEDVACNCLQTGKVQAVIEPCLADPARSNCTADEVNAFAGIVVPVCTQLNATTPAEVEKKCKPVVTVIKSETFTTLCSTSSSYKYIHKPSLSKPVYSSSTPVAPIVTVSSSSYTWVKPAYPVYNATKPVVAPTGTGVWPVAFTGAANIAGVASGALALAMGALLL